MFIIHSAGFIHPGVFPLAFIFKRCTILNLFISAFSIQAIVSMPGVQN